MPQWLEYDWILNSVPSKYRVNMELDSILPHTSMQMLLHVKCGSKDPRGDGMTLRERRRVEALERKCVKQLDAVYAGIIDSGSEVRMYFYTDKERDFEMLRELLDKENGIDCVCKRIFEPQWQTYYKLLYPDAAKYQTVRNKTLIDNISKRGDNTSAPRRINLHMHFPTEPLRLLFQEEARLAGFVIGDAVYAPERDLPYGVVLHRISTLRKGDIDSLTTRAIRVAERFRGALVQWDCLLIQKGSPLK